MAIHLHSTFFSSNTMDYYAQAAAFFASIVGATPEQMLTIVTNSQLLAEVKLILITMINSL